MGFLSELRANRLEAAVSSPDQSATVPAIVGSGTTIYSAPGAVSRDVAVQVPEVKRARDLIAGTIANAKLYEEFSDGTRSESRTFLKQPDPAIPTSTMIASTVADLFFDGVSVWYITSRYKLDNRPATAIHVPWNAASLQYDNLNRLTQGWVNGSEVPLSDLIVFRHSSDGILTTGSSTITTGLYIERAVKSAMKVPMPNLKVKNNGADQTPDEIAEVMEYFAQVLEIRSNFYESRNLEVSAMGWNPEQLALASLRKQQATAFSRLTGVPAWYLSAESGDSLTYSTNTQARQDLFSLTLTPYVQTIEQTLTMVATPYGSEVHFDFFDFLQADPSTRAAIYSQLIPLGIMTVEEARIREGFIEEKM